MTDPKATKSRNDRLLSLAIQLGSDHQAVQALSQLDLSDSEKLELQRLHDALGFIAQVRADHRLEDSVSLGRDSISNPVQNSIVDDALVDAALEDTVGSQLDTHPSQPASPSIDLLQSPTGSRYKLINRIGKGGFADVYLADDQRLARKVALKILRNSEHQSDDAELRFQREAKAVATLSHPNIVPVFDAGKIDGRDFIASEFCQGGTLQQWLSENPPPLAPSLIVTIMMSLAEAVEHAHQRGIIHRDLKPANVFLSDKASREFANPKRSSGRHADFPAQLRIGDFGLARQLSSDQSMATSDGAIVGTPAYMSPEQASGSNKITAATDVFSLGTIFYELLTGNLPFKGDNNIDLLLAITQKETVRPVQFNASMDRDLEAICLKCLQKSPADRYSSAFQLLEDLKRWQTGHAVLARRIQWWDQIGLWVRRNRWQTAAIAAISAALFFALYQWQLAGQQFARANRHFEMSREVVEQISNRVAMDKKLPPEYRKQFLDYAVTLHVNLLREEPNDALLALQTANTYLLYADLMHDLSLFDEAMNSIEQAERLLDRFQQDPQFQSFAQRLTESKLQIGITAGKTNVAEEAAATLDDRTEVTSEEDARRYFNLATMKMAQGGNENLLLAVEQFRLADGLFSQTDPHIQPHRARNYLFWARAENQLNRWEEARTLIAKAMDIWKPLLQMNPNNEAIVEDVGKGYYSLGELELAQLRVKGLPTDADSPHLENARTAFDSAAEVFSNWQKLNPLRSRAYGLQNLALKFAADLEFEQQDLKALRDRKAQISEFLQDLPDTIPTYETIQFDFAKVNLAEVLLMSKQDQQGFEKAKDDCRKLMESQIEAFSNPEEFAPLLEVLENTVLENTVLENTVLENTGTENTSAENTSAENTSAENTSAENTSAENTAAENTATGDEG